LPPVPRPNVGTRDEHGEKKQEWQKRIRTETVAPAWSCCHCRISPEAEYSS
jgi:hypothetical protein